MILCSSLYLPRIITPCALLLDAVFSRHRMFLKHPMSASIKTSGVSQTGMSEEINYSSNKFINHRKNNKIYK